MHVNPVSTVDVKLEFLMLEYHIFQVAYSSPIFHVGNSGLGPNSEKIHNVGNRGADVQRGGLT